VRDKFISRPSMSQRQDYHFGSVCAMLTGNCEALQRKASRPEHFPAAWRSSASVVEVMACKPAEMHPHWLRQQSLFHGP